MCKITIKILIICILSKIKLLDHDFATFIHLFFGGLLGKVNNEQEPVCCSNNIFNHYI